MHSTAFSLLGFSYLRKSCSYLGGSHALSYIHCSCCFTMTSNFSRPLSMCFVFLSSTSFSVVLDGIHSFLLRGDWSDPNSLFSFWFTCFERYPQPIQIYTGWSREMSVHSLLFDTFSPPFLREFDEGLGQFYVFGSWLSLMRCDVMR